MFLIWQWQNMRVPTLLVTWERNNIDYTILQYMSINHRFLCYLGKHASARHAFRPFSQMLSKPIHRTQRVHTTTDIQLTMCLVQQHQLSLGCPPECLLVCGPDTTDRALWDHTNITLTIKDKIGDLETQVKCSNCVISRDEALRCEIVHTAERWTFRSEV